MRDVVAVIQMLIDGGGAFLVRRPESVGATEEETDLLMEGRLHPERKRVLHQAVMGAAQALINSEPLGRA